MKKVYLGIVACFVAALGMAGPAAASLVGSGERDELLQPVRQPKEQLEPLSTDELEILDAIAQLREELARRPDDPGLRGQRAWFYYQGRDYDSAIADLWFVLREDPNLWAARTLLAQVYLEKSDVLCLKDPNSPKAWPLNELAIDELERVLAHTPGESTATELLAQAYNDRAYFLYVRRQDLPLALTLIDQAMALQANESFYAGTKAEVLQAMGRSKEALPYIWRALKDYPNEPELLHDLEAIQSSLSGS